MASEKDVFQRLFKKDTVNSLVRRTQIDSYSDSLDLVLSSIYNHEKDLFASKFKTLLQLENALNNPIKEQLYNEMIVKERNNIHHPLVIGKKCAITRDKKSFNSIERAPIENKTSFDTLFL